MSIDLHNFFRYYDENNSSHVRAVQWLEENLDKSFLDDQSPWVKKYRTKPPSTNLNVPFYPQTDNYTQAQRTCNSSSCAMCLEFLKPGTLKGDKGDDAYIAKVFAVGDTTDHSVQTKVLNSYGVSSVFRYDLSFEDLDEQIAKGKPVVIGILHRGPLSAPTGGHMCVVRGKTPDGKGYYVNDPYGTCNDGYTSSVYNGKNTIYSKDMLKHRWLEKGKAKTGWGRIFTGVK